MTQPPVRDRVGDGDRGDDLDDRGQRLPDPPGGHPRVDAVRGAVAIERGPIVYAVEQADQADGALVDDLEIVGDLFRVETHPQLGVPAVHVDGRVRTASGTGPVVDVVAIPYSHWANREVGPMKVWLPDARSTTVKEHLA